MFMENEPKTVNCFLVFNLKLVMLLSAVFLSVSQTSGSRRSELKVCKHLSVSKKPELYMLHVKCFFFILFF